MKRPYTMGKEARVRETSVKYNPFDLETEEKQHFRWEDGWMDKDLEIMIDSGLEFREYIKSTKHLLKY